MPVGRRRADEGENEEVGEGGEEHKGGVRAEVGRALHACSLLWSTGRVVSMGAICQLRFRGSVCSETFARGLVRKESEMLNISLGLVHNMWECSESSFWEGREIRQI